MKTFYLIGQYFGFLLKVFRKPEKGKVFRQQTLIEIDVLGIESLGIVAIISVFMGAVLAIQTASNIDNPLIPLYTIGFATRQSMVLEFSPTIVSLILAGKVGSRISSEIGTMRITEQIDALEIMGINSAQHLALPKITASLIINPVLITISMFCGCIGAYLASMLSDLVTSYHFIEGLQLEFKIFHLVYAYIKTLVFAFIISSVSAFFGYYVSGGALEVGRASTKAVVSSSILIILFNLILTQLLLV
ncbi:MAG: ABC transporter permease [Bacteroidales bacterium]|nr:ABC transporter permease [Bacteroidales bacterium]